MDAEFFFQIRHFANELGSRQNRRGGDGDIAFRFGSLFHFDGFATRHQRPFDQTFMGKLVGQHTGTFGIDSSRFSITRACPRPAGGSDCRFYGTTNCTFRFEREHGVFPGDGAFDFRFQLVNPTCPSKSLSNRNTPHVPAPARCMHRCTLRPRSAVRKNPLCPFGQCRRAECRRFPKSPRRCAGSSTPNVFKNFPVPA